MPGSSRKVLICSMALVLTLGALIAAQAPPAPKPQGPVTADDFNQFTWRWIGPMTFSGRITGFAVPRGQSQTYYVLTASGGLWKTVDGGIHFDPVFEKYGTGSMGWMAIAPSDPNILYLGTGEPMHARASTHGNGMWKSTDAGKTWTHIGLEKSYFIPMVAIDARNPNVVYAAAEGKLYDNEMDCERGLFKTTDGGKTWTNLGPMKDRGVGDFVIDPANSDVVIASAYKHYRRAWTYDDRAAGNGIYKTTDGGKSWKKLAGGLPGENAVLGRIGLAIFEKNPKVVYARVDEEVNLGFQERDGLANFRAPDTAQAGGGMGGFGRGPATFKDGFGIPQFKAYRINAELAKTAPKFTPIVADNEADLVKKLNEIIADKEFLTKSGIDVGKFTQAARKLYAKDDAALAQLDELDKLLKKPAAAADSTEAKGRSQIVNRIVLETLYTGAFNSVQPVKRNGVVYRSDDQGETWKRMTEYRLPANTPPITTSDDDATSARQGFPGPSDVEDALAESEYDADVAAGAQAAQRSGAQGLGSAQVNQTEGGYYGRIIVDQLNDQVVYCGDTNATVSRDSGRTFQPTGWDGRGKTHVDHRVVWVDPMNSGHILSGNDGGVAESWDGGKHFSQKNTINAEQFYDVSVDNELPYNVMGGTQDNGAWLGPSQNRNQYGLFGADWRYLPTGDAFYVVRDTWNPEYVYFESQFGASQRMNLATGETSPLAVRLTPEQVSNGETPLRYQWNAPIVLSPHNPGIVFIANQYVWRSLSRGERGTFVKISPDLTKADRKKLAEAKKTNLQWATVYTFSESPKKPGLYWAGTDDGNVQMSPDGGVTWVNITNQFYDAAGKAKPGIKGDLIPYDRWVKRVVASAFDENTAYVAFSGYRTHNEDKTWLFVTHDLGKTWTDISGGMTNPIFDVEEDPANANVLYLGTDYGIYVTIDRGKSWTAFSTSAPNVTVRDLAIQKRDREMAIATYGRGFYVCDIGPIKEFTPEVFQESAHLFDVKNAIKWNRYEQRGDTLGEMAKADNPQVGASIYYYLKADAQKVTLTIKDLEGTTIQEYPTASKKGLQKVFWNLTRQPAGQAGGGRGGRGGQGGAAPDTPNPDQPPMGRGRVNLVDAGVYKVTLAVDGKDVATKKLTVLPDPLFK